MQKYFNIANDVVENQRLESSSFKLNDNVKNYRGKNGLTKESFTVNGYDARKKFGLQNGKYSIISFENIMIATPKMINYLVNHLSLELSKYLGKLNANSKVLVVALGNKNISADSLGYNAINKIIVSSLHGHLSIFEGVPKTYAIATSVLGLTGVESSDIVKGVVEKIKPNKIIVIDTLCTSSYKRLGTSFQINNAGIVPGGGIGNKRKELTEKNLGVPVISFGVPLVMYAHSLVDEAVRVVSAKYSAQNIRFKDSSYNQNENNGASATENKTNKTASNTKTTESKNMKTKDVEKESELRNSNFFNIINDLQNFKFNNLLITVKDIEEVVGVCGQVVAMAINKAITGFSVEKQKQIIYRL